MKKSSYLSKSAVRSWRNQYQADGKRGVTFGKKGDLIFTFPQSICWDWADSSAGDSGGDNPRPIGINLTPTWIKDNFGGSQKKTVAYFMKSDDNLEELIRMSRRNYGKAEIQARMKRKARASIKIPSKLPNIDVKVTRPKSNEILIKISF